jgi:hypothetical protein
MRFARVAHRISRSALIAIALVELRKPRTNLTPSVHSGKSFRRFPQHIRSTFVVQR